jgi:hypothetical protein
MTSRRDKINQLIHESLGSDRFELFDSWEMKDTLPFSESSRAHTSAQRGSSL